MRDADTIVALSSGATPSGVAVIRLSGSDCRTILLDIAGTIPEPRRLTLRSIRLMGELIDSGLVAWFPAPNSFTGEDCAELQLHGSPAVIRAVLRGIETMGVRLAEAGEFTRRAFENGQLDLTEVEGLGDLIEAETESQRVQALARLSGGLSEKVADWRGELLGLRAEIEAQLDFSDEGDVVDNLSDDFVSKIKNLRAALEHALSGIKGGRLVREGFRVVLAGAPNAGKSSLLNALARSDIAIVTEEAGTTRDVREVPVDLDGHLVVLVDTAGLRETESVAEAEGVRRAKNAMQMADLVFWLRAPDGDVEAPATGDVPIWRVASKADLGAAEGDVAVSVVTPSGLDELLTKLRAEVAERAGNPGSVLVSRERDRAALQAAVTALEPLEGLLGQPELAAEALRRASDSLARLVGEVDSEAVLDRLFLSFCIGK